jgi:hypothetical protein
MQGPASWLVYWQVFWSEWKEYGPRIYTIIYHTRSKWFYNAVRSGDDFWLVVSADGRNLGVWRLAMRFTVRGKSFNQSKWRPYKFVPELRGCDLFCLDGQADLAPVLRKLTFASGRRITATGRLIGGSLQTPRRLASRDLSILQDRALTLRRI